MFNRTKAFVTCFVASIVMLSACTTSYPGSPQTYAGINHAKFSYNAGTKDFKGEVFGGKENENVVLNGETPSGFKIHYEAKGSTAFVGQMTQAELSALIANQITQSLSPIVQP